jgi:hypothetical protein
VVYSFVRIHRCFIEFPSHLASLRRGSTIADRSSSKPKVEDDTIYSFATKLVLIVKSSF